MVSDQAKRIGAVVGGILAFLLLVGLIAYAADYGVEATVTEKGRDSEGRYIVATTEIGGFDVKRYLPADQWFAVQEGFFVVYHIQSGATEVYTSEDGRLIWRG